MCVGLVKKMTNLAKTDKLHHLLPNKCFANKGDGDEDK